MTRCGGKTAAGLVAHDERKGSCAFKAAAAIGVD